MAGIRQVVDHSLGRLDGHRVRRGRPGLVWTVTEYAVDGLDWCAVAEYPGGYFHLAALSGSGRAAVVQYTGSGNLADHIEELAAMVR